MTAQVDIILLAAGASSRMKGGDKTLEPVNGTPLLRHLVLECLGSQGRHTVVVLPPDRPERKSVVNDLDITVVIAQDAELGMSASIKAGINAVAGADAVLVMLADMPEIRTAHLDKIIAAYREDPSRKVIRAVGTDGAAGHPVLFDKSHFEALRILAGDKGAKDVLQARPVHAIRLEGTAAITDLDTPEDWERWRSK